MCLLAVNPGPTGALSWIPRGFLSLQTLCAHPSSKPWLRYCPRCNFLQVLRCNQSVSPAVFEILGPNISWPFRVIGHVTNRFTICHFLLVVHWNWAYKPFSRYSAPAHAHEHMNERTDRRTSQQTRRITFTIPPVRDNNNYTTPICTVSLSKVKMSKIITDLLH